MKAERWGEGKVAVVDGEGRTLTVLTVSEAEDLRVSLFGAAQDERRRRWAVREQEERARTVKDLSIAVYVREDGFAYVGRDAETACPDPRLMRWVTASVPLPQSVEVQGTTEEKA